MSGGGERWKSRVDRSEERAKYRRKLQDLGVDAEVETLVKALEAKAFAAARDVPDYREKLFQGLREALLGDVSGAGMKAGDGGAAGGSGAAEGGGGRRPRRWTGPALKDTLGPLLSQLRRVPQLHLRRAKELVELGDSLARPTEDLWSVVERMAALAEEADGLAAGGPKEFQSRLDEAARSLGLCCAQRKRFFSRRSIPCSGSFEHSILPGQAYHTQDPASSPFGLCSSALRNYCVKCFKSLPKVDQDGLPKTSMEKRQNPKEAKAEPEVICDACGLKIHSVCAGLAMDPHVFICAECAAGRGAGKEEAARPARFRDLPETVCSAFVEERLNSAMAALSKDPFPPAVIRTLSHQLATLKLPAKLVALHPGLQGEHGYHARYLYAVQEQNNKDVPVFGLIIYEFDSTSTLVANRGSVYVSYLEGLPFLEPNSLNRKSFFHTLLLAVFAFYSQADFVRAHLWSCAPGDPDEEYMFFGRTVPKAQGPAETKAQQVARQARLDGWYGALGQKGIEEGVIERVEDGAAYLRRSAGSTADLTFYPGDVVLWTVGNEVGGRRKASGADLLARVLQELSSQSLLVLHLRRRPVKGRRPELGPPLQSLVAGSRLGLLDWQGAHCLEHHSRRLAAYSLRRLVEALEEERRAGPPTRLLALLVHSARCMGGAECREGGCPAIRRSLLHLSSCRRGRALPPAQAPAQAQARAQPSKVLRRGAPAAAAVASGGPSTAAAAEKDEAGVCKECLGTAALLRQHSLSCHEEPCPLPLCQRFRNAAADHVSRRVSLG